MTEATSKAKTKADKSFSLYDGVNRKTLKNGLRVITVPLAHLHTSTVSAFVRVGSRDETHENNGISHFLEHMLFRGNDVYESSYDLNLAVESIGGELYAATHADFTLYQISLPPENIVEGIRILAETLRTPALSDTEAERKIIREEVLESLDENYDCIDIDDVSHAHLFEGHPLGFPIIGRLENIERFSAAELKQYHATFYQAANIVLCLTGKLDMPAVMSAAEQHFGILPAGSLPKRQAFIEKPSKAQLHYVHHDDSQSELRLSFRCPGENDENLIALQLLCRVLDDGMSTRLHRRICEEQALAYDVFASLELYEECGVFDVGISVEHQKIPLALQALFDLIRDLRDNGVLSAELEKAQKRFVWDLQASVDDAEDTAYVWGMRTLLGCDQTSFDFLDRVKAASIEQLAKLSEKIFRPEHLHVTCVGSLSPELVSQTEQLLAQF
ncbi:MAG: insulinase family protein [Myxococcales bacterium]|nr:MAG: insulinase family protein [Myxococcales bacterium]